MTLVLNSFDPTVMTANGGILQTAIGAGELIMPAGVIAHDNQLGQWSVGTPLEMRGAGKDLTRLYPKCGANTGFTIGHPTPGGLVTLEKFAIIGEQTSILMYMQKVGSPTLRDITLDNGYYGLHMWETFAAVLENVFITNSKGLGLYVQGVDGGNGYVLRNCRFFNCGHPTSRAALRIDGGDAILIDGIGLEGCYTGMELPNCRGVAIVSPYIERLARDPITFGGYAAGVNVLGGWIGGHSGQSPSWWDISEVANLKLRGTTLFNLAIRRHVASTPGFELDGVTLINTTVTDV